VIDGKGQQFRRRPIAMINIESTELDEEQNNTEKRWITHDFIMNLYDLWVQPHFEKICSVIDMLPADLYFDVSEQDQELASSRSGLSQQLKDYSLADGRVIPESQPSVQPITPDTTIQTGSSNVKKKTKR
jgi:hypothetical protein